MNLTITPTDKTTNLNGMIVRLWSGTAENGMPVQVIVAGVAVELEGATEAEADYLSKKLRGMGDGDLDAALEAANHFRTRRLN